MKFTYEGKEFEFYGDYLMVEKGMHYLSSAGTILKATSNIGIGALRAIVRPVEVLHTFGGVEYQEVGIGTVVFDQCYLYNYGDLAGPRVWLGDAPSNTKYTILEPVRII